MPTYEEDRLKILVAHNACFVRVGCGSTTSDGAHALFFCVLIGAAGRGWPRSDECWHDMLPPDAAFKGGCLRACESVCVKWRSSNGFNEDPAQALALYNASVWVF